MSANDKDAVITSNSSQDIAPSGAGAADDSVAQQRRKLIKATAAVVPAVMTLRSGAAAAMTSTYHCTARDNAAALEGVDYVLEAPDDVMPHDTWLRVPGRRVSVTDDNNQVYTCYCVDTGAGDPNLRGWQCFNEADGLECTGTPPPISWNDIRTAQGVALLAFLDFDAGGDDTENPVLFYPIKRVEPAPPGYSPITGSCLSSIHPNLDLLGQG